MASDALGEVAKIVMGQSPPGEACNEAGLGVPLLNGPTEFGPHHPTPVQFTTDPRKRARPGDILFCVRGSTTGRMNWADQEYAIGRGVAAIRHNKGTEYQPFLRAVIEYQLPELLAQATGSTFPNVSFSQLADVPCPPLTEEEQHAIAHILGTLDDKIELNRRMNETLEAMARAIFKSWFVDFDPVRAKAEGRDPGLPKPLAALFPNGFEDSELGEIPAGWEVGRLGDALSVIETGSRPRGGVKDIAQGVPSVGAESIVGLGHFDYGKTRFVPREFFGSMRKGHVRDGDVLLYKDGGRPGEFEPHVTIVGDGFPFHEFCINEHVYRLRSEPGLPQAYLYSWLSSDSVMEGMRNRGTGVAVPGLNSTAVRELPVLRPPSGVLSAFASKVQPMVRAVFANCNESRTLAGLRDALLPRLISGDLRVTDAERVLEVQP